jgi:hypothetical protein
MPWWKNFLGIEERRPDLPDSEQCEPSGVERPSGAETELSRNRSVTTQVTTNTSISAEDQIPQELESYGVNKAMEPQNFNTQQKDGKPTAIGRQQPSNDSKV